MHFLPMRHCLPVARVGLSLYLIVYHLLFVGQAAWIWGAEGLVARELIFPPNFSLVFATTAPWIVNLSVALIVGLSILVLWLKKPAPIYGAIFILHTSLLNANPLIVHEPHQLTQLLLIYLTLQCIVFQRRQSIDSVLAHTWTAFVLVYYFMAALKKLPDPHWLSGDALGLLLQWEGLARPTASTVAKHVPDVLLKLTNYVVLILELSAPVFFFYRHALLVWTIGVLSMHFFIELTMDVGYFGWVMAIAVISALESSHCFHKQEHKLRS